eukprot:c30855_g1_i1 orf=61-249(+)
MNLLLALSKHIKSFIKQHRNFLVCPISANKTAVVMKLRAHEVNFVRLLAFNITLTDCGNGNE